jgi:hypothetical protein
MTNAEYYKNQGLTYEDIFNFWVQRQPKDNRSLNEFFLVARCRTTNADETGKRTPADICRYVQS